ncbi:MAG: hypothetical protein WCS99_15475 [Limisphaerales bacterium]
MLLVVLSVLVGSSTLSAQRPAVVGAGGGVGRATAVGAIGKLVALDAKTQTLTLRQHKWGAATFNSPGASPLISRVDDGKDWTLCTYRLSPQTRFFHWPNLPANREEAEKLMGKRVSIRIGAGKASSPSVLAVNLWAEFSGARGTLISVDAAAGAITVNCPPLAEDFDPRDTKSAADVTARIAPDCAFLAYDQGVKLTPGKSVSAKPSSLAAFKPGSRILVNFIRTRDGSLLARMMVLNQP